MFYWEKYIICFTLHTVKYHHLHIILQYNKMTSMHYPKIWYSIPFSGFRKTVPTYTSSNPPPQKKKKQGGNEWILFWQISFLFLVGITITGNSSLKSLDVQLWKSLGSNLQSQHIKNHLFSSIESWQNFIAVKKNNNQQCTMWTN